MKIWFGEHEGTEVADLPVKYLWWLVNKFDVIKGPPHEIERRRDLISEAEDALADKESSKSPFNDEDV